MKMKDLIRILIEKKENPINKKRLAKIYYSLEEVKERFNKKELFWYITNWRYSNSVQLIEILRINGNTAIVKNMSGKEQFSPEHLKTRKKIDNANIFKIDIENRVLKEEVISKLDCEINVGINDLI